MHVKLFRPGPRRWVLALVLGIIAPVLFMAIPNAPARDAWVNPDLGTANAAFTMERIGFLQPRAAELREQSARPLVEPSTEQIAAMLGRLAVQDETLAREPLLGMRLAGRALLTGGDPWSARQLSQWAALLVSRIDGMAIPDGTREALLRQIAVYEHDALTMNNARIQAGDDVGVPGEATATGAVDIPGANGARAIGEARQPVPGVALPGWWLLGAVLVVVALITAGGGFTFGRTTGLGNTLVRN